MPGSRQHPGKADRSTANRRIEGRKLQAAHNTDPTRLALAPQPAKLGALPMVQRTCQTQWRSPQTAGVVIDGAVMKAA